MTDSPREEIYHIEGHTFIKRYAPGGVAFLCDGRELTLEEWNVELNRVQPMRLLEEHPNPAVRLKEAHRRRAFTNMVRAVPGGTAADIGCEEGHLAELLAPKFEKLFCIDIDLRMLDSAASRLSRFDNIEYMAGDVLSLDLPDDSLDACVAAEVLEHLPEPEAGLDELARVTKPGGRIYISVPNEKLLQNLKRMVRRVGMGRSLGRLSGGIAVGHVQVFSKRRLDEICRGRVKLDTLAYSTPFFLNIFAAGTPVK